MTSWDEACRLIERSPFVAQTLLANGLVAPNAVSSLIAALASTFEAPRQQPPAPSALADPGLAAAFQFQGPAQQVPTLL